MNFISCTVADLVRKNQFYFKARAEKVNQESITEQTRNSKLLQIKLELHLLKLWS